LTLKSGFTITELAGECCDCGGPLKELRGEVREYGNCSDLRFAGRCEPCKTIVTCRFRRYQDGRFEQERDGNWQLMGIVTLKTRLQKLLHKLKGRMPWTS
jgi:hypothetical protein